MKSMACGFIEDSPYSDGEIINQLSINVSEFYNYALSSSNVRHTQAACSDCGLRAACSSDCGLRRSDRRVTHSYGRSLYFVFYII